LEGQHYLTTWFYYGWEISFFGKVFDYGVTFWVLNEHRCLIKQLSTWWSSIHHNTNTSLFDNIHFGRLKWVASICMSFGLEDPLLVVSCENPPKPIHNYCGGMWHSCHHSNKWLSHFTVASMRFLGSSIVNIKFFDVIFQTPMEFDLWKQLHPN
jgi:hypothetical protein